VKVSYGGYLIALVRSVVQLEDWLILAEFEPDVSLGIGA
jgi:hypothetical protein